MMVFILFENDCISYISLSTFEIYFILFFQKKIGLFSWMRDLETRVPDYYVESRPYFTYWVTSVHITVLILSMVLYPMAPYGYGLKHITGEVFTTSLSHEVIEYEDPASFWIGPRQSALVALGAKFTPCMRVDPTVQAGIDAQVAIEADTACCIRHDHSGCVQTLENQCSSSLSRWAKWSEEFPGPDNRTSGSVCGQDPRTCNAPASVPPNEWPDDITEWPVCQSSNKSQMTSSLLKDMSYTCEVVGRPCCVGIHGECHITTRQHCDLLHGYFHEEAALCSQVYCLSDVCKMLKFLNPEVPDQIYRLWMALFIHAGLIPFFLTIFLHITYLRNLEKFAGTVRVTIIYILSGVAGNLASAIFVPSRPEVGPAGSLAGVIACLFVIFVSDFIDDMRQNLKVMFGWLVFLLVCFTLGLFPGVDNFANMFGFLMGLFLSVALLPHIGQRTAKVNPGAERKGSIAFVGGEFHGLNTPSGPSSPRPQSSVASAHFFPEFDADAELPPPPSSSKRCRLIMVLMSLTCAVGLLVGLFVVFYLVPFECAWCGYLDCVPFTPDFCAEQQTSFERHKIIT